MAETTPHGYVVATLSTLQKLKLDTLIATRRSRQHDFAAAVKVFDGNTANPNKVSTEVQRVNRRFGLQQIVVAGDRGMLFLMLSSTLGKIC